MTLYQKLACVGSIWSLLVYLFILISAIASYVILYPNESLFLDSSPESTAYRLSMSVIRFSLGIIGTATSIIVIIAISKIKPTMKKLSTVLIISAIVIVVSPYAAFYAGWLHDIDYVRDAEDFLRYTSEADYQAERNYTIFMVTFILGIIPSSFIMVSWIYAFKIYQKSKS